MALTLTDSLIAALAPGERALLDARGLLKKSSLQKLRRDGAGTLLWGECKGSSATPYALSVDLDTGGERPTARCTCPSRQTPCKHALGMMLSYVANAGSFVAEEAPAELLEKRAKAQAKSKGEAEAEAAPAEASADGEAPKPRKKSAAEEKKRAEAAKKKVGAQAEALEQLERFLLDAVSAGLGSLAARGGDELREQSRRLGDANLPGPRDLMLRFAWLVDGEKKNGPKGAPALPQEERNARMAQLVTQLWVTVRKGKKVLEGKLEEGESKGEADAQVESILGKAWRLPELREAGYWTSGRKLLELAHERTDDHVTDKAVARGFLLDLESGDVLVEVTALPFIALNSEKARLRTSRTGVLEVRQAALYPGDALNRRVRWDEGDPEAVFERPRAAEDYALVHARARTLEAAVKLLREQLRNPLAPTDAVLLLGAKSFGLTAEDELVLEDSAGARLVLRDPPDTQYATTANLRHAAGAYGPGAVAVRLWFDPKERALFGQALALFAGDKHLRLGM